MSYYRMVRGWMDNPIFKREPYTEAQAWEWLISEAAWKCEKRRVASSMVNIERGQLVISMRFAAETLMWDKSSVKRYTKRLEDAHMIELSTETGITVITIVNYDTYQTIGEKNGQESGQINGQESGHDLRQKRDSNEPQMRTIYRKESKESKEDLLLTTNESVAAAEQLFEEFWKFYPEKKAKLAARKAWSKITMNVPTFDQIMLGLERYILEKPAQQHWAHPATWLNQERWLDGEAELPAAPQMNGNGVHKPKYQRNADKWPEQSPDVEFDVDGDPISTATTRIKTKYWDTIGDNNNLSAEEHRYWSAINQWVQWVHGGEWDWCMLGDGPDNPQHRIPRKVIERFRAAGFGDPADEKLLTRPAKTA